MNDIVTTMNQGRLAEIPFDVPAIEAVAERCRFPGGIAASALGGEFGAARFTRDYLAVMSDFMETNPALVREGFSQIPQEQGMTFDPLTAEQQGRFPHQVAYNKWGDLWVPEATKESRRYWASRWGIPFDEEKGFVVWNQTDGSRYVHELRRFVDLYGPAVLEDTFRHRRSGETRTVQQAAVEQLDWMVRTIEGSDLGLLEVQEFNSNQTSWSGVMRDGYDAYFHPVGERGKALNRDKPIAYFETQGLAVQSFLAAIELFKNSEDTAMQARIAKWRELVQELPNRIFDAFRWEEEDYFVPAIDRDEDGRPRQVKLVSSVVAETLATPEWCYRVTREGVNAQDIFRGIVTKVFSSEFMTPAGIRMLSLRYAPLEGEGYAYQGSKVVWPVTQWRIADGLDLIGLPELAEDLRNERVLPALQKAGNMVEAFYVSPQMTVGYRKAIDGLGSLLVMAQEEFSKDQAWTASGARKALWRRNYPLRTPGPQKYLVARARSQVKDILTAKQDKLTTYTIDREQGAAWGAARAAAMGGIALVS